MITNRAIFINYAVMIFGLLALVFCLDSLLTKFPGSGLLKFGVLLSLCGIVTNNIVIHKETKDLESIPMTILLFACVSAVYYLFIR